MTIMSKNGVVTRIPVARRQRRIWGIAWMVGVLLMIAIVFLAMPRTMARERAPPLDPKGSRSRRPATGFGQGTDTSILGATPDLQALPVHWHLKFPDGQPAADATITEQDGISGRGHGPQTKPMALTGRGKHNHPVARFICRAGVPSSSTL